LPQLELPDPYDGVEYDCQAEEVVVADDSTEFVDPEFPLDP
jgi:hypothetical protein